MAKNIIAFLIIYVISSGLMLFVMKRTKDDFQE